MGKEIEVKIRLTEEEFRRIEMLIREVCPEPQEERHCDVYFSRSGGFLDEQYPYEWLSIREREGAAIACYKHFFPEGAEAHSYCDEVEVGVSSGEAARRFLVAIGFEEAVTVRKTRTTYAYENTAVSFDHVEYLGFFIEVEAEERSDVRKGTAAVRRVLQSLALSSKPRDLRGYPFRLLERRRGNWVEG